MLPGIAIATATLVAACVVSIVRRPDEEVLRPIDRQSCGPCAERPSDVESSLSGDRTARTADLAASQEGTVA